MIQRHLPMAISVILFLSCICCNKVSIYEKILLTVILADNNHLLQPTGEQELDHPSDRRYLRSGI